MAAAGTAGVSWATCASTQRGGRSMAPASGTSSPRMAANRLDLPDPFEPTSPTLWRSCTVSDALSKSGLVPRASTRFEMRSISARSSQLEVAVDDERRVVGEAAVPVNRRRARRRCNARRGDLIVDAPSDVLLPRPPAIGPPRVLVRTRVDAAKHVDESHIVEHARQPRPLLGQEAGMLLVAAPVAKVDRLVSDVPVAAQHDFATACDELSQVRQERFEKTELRRLSMRAAGARRQVDADDRQPLEVRLQIATFAVEFRMAEAGGELRRRLCIQRDAAVALALRSVERRMRLPRRGQRPRNVGMAAFDLLQAHDIPRLGTRQPAREALALRRAQAVDVEGDDSHRFARKAASLHWGQSSKSTCCSDPKVASKAILVARNLS